MDKPDTYKVARWQDYGIARIRYHEATFRWYWQANLYSWIFHHVFGCSCNTLRKTLP